MGLLCDYFLASNDEEAAATIDWLGGPRQPPAPRGVLRRQKAAPRPTVSLPGIEPAVMMSTLENVLTGRSLDELIPQNARSSVAVRDGGERIVMRLSDTLQAALAGSDETRLRQAARPWSQTDEFFGQGDPALLGGALVDLATLARRGQSVSERMYCWVCV